MCSSLINLFSFSVRWKSYKLLFAISFFFLHHHTLTSADPVPTDTDDFKSLLLNTNLYIDRSLLIEELMLRQNSCDYVIRPKGWGKTLNMDMLRRFFDLETYPNGTIVPDDLKQNRILFTGGQLTLPDNKTTKVLKPLKIAANKEMMKLQGNHPVIYLNLSGIDGTCFDEFQAGIRASVFEMFKKFKYLTSSPNLTEFESVYMKRFFTGLFFYDDIILSMNFLSKLLFNHFGKKVILLVDEYDTPVINAYQRFHRNRPNLFVDVFYYMRCLYIQAFHLNEFLERRLTSGVIKLLLLRDNYFYSFLDEKYSKYYGFREHDLDELFANVSFTPDREKIRHWYGYKFQDNEQLYHPGKIMRYIASNGTFDYYWLDPKYTGIDQTLLLDDMQTHIRNLSIGLSVKSYANLTNERNFAKINPINQHVLLLYFGFLTPSNGKWNETEQQQLAPANLQVEHLLQFKVLEWVAGKLNVTIKDLSQMEGDTLIEKVERFRDALGRRVELLSDVVSRVRPSDRRKSATIENLSQNASDGQFLGDGLMTSTEKSSR